MTRGSGAGENLASDRLIDTLTEMLPMRNAPRIMATTLLCLLYLLSDRVVLGERAARPHRPPNIVLVLADDLGWAELGCYGNRFNETPNIDRMARQGMRFTQAYAVAPVCSPYRVGLMAGQWPARVGITDYLRPDDEKHLKPEVVTLAESLKRAGYATGIVGKWHLTGYTSAGAEEISPDEQGFDEVMISETCGIAGGSYFHPYHFNPQVKARLPSEHLVDRVNLEAVEFIERNHKRPFFLYLSHYAVHTRMVGRPDLVAKYEKKPGAGRGNNAPRNNPHLAAQLESIDQGVGKILARLKELGIDDRTLVIVTSDNGGEARVTSNAPLRGGKSMLYEGGIREPLVVRFPGIVPPGTVCRWPVANLDFYPTLIELAGLKPAAGQVLDGVSIVPLLRDPAAELSRDTLYWHYPLARPHFLGGQSGGAIRQGDWKLIEWFDSGKKELYNLADDVGEAHDLAAKMPDRVAELHAKLKAWRKEVGAPEIAPTPRIELPIAGRRWLLDSGTVAATEVSPTARRFDGKDDCLELPRDRAPQVRGRTLRISARVVPDCSDGVILAHGGNRTGYALYLASGRPTLSICVDWKRTTISSPDKLGPGAATLSAEILSGGRLVLRVNGNVVAEGKSAGLLPADPGDSLQVGADLIQPVGEYKAPNWFRGVIDGVELGVGK